MNQKSQKSKKNQSKTVELNSKGRSLKKYYYLLGILTFFIFANSIGNGYNMDDGIVTNGHKLTSQGLSAVGEIFTSNYYSDAMGYAFGYRPMVHLSFAIEHELFGEKPGAGHFINVVLFAFCVVLFFKLLVRWVGEKNLLFAGVATLLFAIHPIHTEVVNSLKNRDEILAFLFVIWAGLSAHKFLEKGRWISIVSIIVLFSMAMLSKKSVYPMTIVIPSALILLTHSSVKQLIILCLTFIIPAAIIGSELQLTRMGVMIVLPMVILVFLYIIKIVYLSDKELNENLSQIKSCVVPFALISLIVLIAIYFSSFIILIALIPLFIWLFKINFEIGLMVMIFALIGIDLFWLGSFVVQILLLILGFAYGIFFMLKKERNIKLWFLLIITGFYYMVNNFNLIDFALFSNAIIFSILLNKKTLWAVAFSALSFIFTEFIFKGEQIYPVLLFLVSISAYAYQKTKSKKWIQYTPILLFSIALGFVSYNEFQVPNANPLMATAQQEKPKFVKNENILKEGRMLEAVENTLVTPHTKEETIGTGFATLGEYFRLMTFPYELSFYYGYAKTDTHGLRNFWVWLFILIHLGMLVLAFYHIKKNPLITIGVFWYLLCIVLFSNWVELVAGMVGERLAFTASAGFCIFIAGILFWIKPDLSVKKPGIIGYSLIIVMILFTGRTIVRNTDWKDTVTLMGNDIKHLTNSSQANNIYAMHLMAESTNNRSLTAVEVREMQDKAIKHFDIAVKIWPDYYNVYIDKARATTLTGDYQEGIRSLEKAIKVDPKNEYSYYIALDICERMNDNDLYLKNALKLFELNQNEHAYGAVARGYFLKNDFQKSKEILLKGIEKFPNNDALKYNLTLVEQKTN